MSTEPAKLFHFTFAQPVRVMLQTSSTPIMAATGSDATDAEGMSAPCDGMMVLKARWIFPTANNPIKAAMTLYVRSENIIGAIEVREPK
jgi:hypothetical protein